MNSPHINKLSEKDIAWRQRQFNEVYPQVPGTKVLEGMTYNDAKWNYDMVVLKVRDRAGKNYGLVEHYKEGDDNSTSFVLLEYQNKAGEFCQEKFEKYVDAEKAMVKLIERRLKGEA